MQKFFEMKYFKYIIAGLMLLLVLVSGNVYAKYYHADGGTATVRAKEFYFESDYLTEDGAEYTLSSDTTSIAFTLKNYADQLRVSEDLVNYTYWVEKSSLVATAAEQTESGENGQTSTGSGVLGNGTDDSGKQIITQEAKALKIEGVSSGNQYKVTATGENGYKKTLSATFIIPEDKTGVYKYLDTTNENYMLLTVWTENVSGELTISTTKTGLIPDSTDAILSGVKNYDSEDNSYGTITGITDSTNFKTNYSSYTYRFFTEEKDNAGAYSVGDFTVKLASGSNVMPAAVSTPQ